MVGRSVAAVVHFRPSGDVSTKYLRINYTLLPAAGIHVILAVVVVITNA